MNDLVPFLQTFAIRSDAWKPKGSKKKFPTRLGVDWLNQKILNQNKILLVQQFVFSSILLISSMAHRFLILLFITSPILCSTRQSLHIKAALCVQPTSCDLWPFREKVWELLGKKSSWRNHEITWHQDLVFDLNLKNCYLKDSWIHSPFPPSFTTLYPFLSASTFWTR